MTDFVLFEQDGAIVTLTLNRPDERNALSTQAQWDELVNCCARVRADESVKVLILTGAGTAFSAGGNVKDMRDKKGIAGGSPYDVQEPVYAEGEAYYEGESTYYEYEDGDHAYYDYGSGGGSGYGGNSR